MAAFQFNPILVREVRARWRKWPAFAVVFGFTALLAIVIGLRYAESATSGSLNTSQRGAALGHDLFGALTITQVVGWMALAPILTITGLLNEREQGHLEGLLLSHLKAVEIINGKLLSVLSFVGLMLLAPLPVITVCFLLGGVSPGELLVATLLNFMTAVFCGLIGLNSAAWNYGRGTVFVRALGMLFFLALMPCCSFPSPLLAAVFLTTDSSPGLGWTLGSMGVQLMISLFLWKSAVRGLQRPLAQQLQEETKKVVYSPAVVAIGSRARLQMPLALRLRFTNPLLHRDVQRRLRIPYVSEWVEWLIILPAIVFCMVLVPLFLSSEANGNLYWFNAYGWLLMMTLGGAVLGAETFALEREANTWEALLLTPLSIKEIISGKLRATLLVCWYYSLPFICIMFVCAGNLIYHHADAFVTIFATSLSIAVIVGTSLWSCAALGLLVSWFCKRVWVSMCWSLAILFFTFAFVPILMGDVGTPLLAFTNPWLSLSMLQGFSSFFEIIGYSTMMGLVFFVTGCLLLGLLYSFMNSAIRQALIRDRKQAIKA